MQACESFEVLGKGIVGEATSGTDARCAGVRPPAFLSLRHTARPAADALPVSCRSSRQKIKWHASYINELRIAQCDWMHARLAHF